MIGKNGVNTLDINRKYKVITGNYQQTDNFICAVPDSPIIYKCKFLL